jgi:hypothetical protein
VCSAAACLGSAAPRFSLPGGVYTNASVSIELTAEWPGSSIRYTLNGTEPGTKSFLYTNAIVISNSGIIRAKEFVPNQPPSPTVTQAYTFLGTDLTGFSSNLPVGIINTYGRGPSENVWTAAAVRFIEPNGGRTTLFGEANYDGRAGIALRGSSSLTFPKQPYKLELWDQGTNDLQAPLLGMPSESDWVLYPPYSDKTLIRNALAYEWHQRMGHYAVRTRLVELFVDVFGGRLTMSDYRGVYLLVEKIKRSPHRVDIQKLTPADNAEPNITGGYIIKEDRLDPGEVGFSTARGIQFGYVEPKNTEITASQKAWLKGWLTQFEAALYGANFKDPTNGYARYIDVPSFLDQHWIVEMTKNIDGFRLSNYMHKDRLGKLCMDPIWDWDLSLGNANYMDAWKTNGWYWTQLSDAEYPWFRRLFQDPDFTQRYIDRWAELRQEVFNTTNLLARVDELSAQLSEAQARNFRRWPVLGTYVWPNWYIGKTYQDEINWMKQWLTGRLAWIDSNYLPAPKLSQNGGAIKPELALTMQAPLGTIYYMLDGTDPRLKGGSLNSKALAYSGPMLLSAEAHIFARTRYTNAWSAPTLATFTTNLASLVITELMYHPPPPPPGSFYTTEDFEFIELMNASTLPLGLNGIHFTAGVEFTFPDSAITNLGPAERIVIVKNRAAFAQRYGPGLPVAGEYSGKLENAGERITLCNSSGKPILDFAYDGQWYPSTAGLGYSLVAVNPRPTDPNGSDSSDWRPGSVFGGSPGTDDEFETYPTWRQRYFNPDQLASPVISGDAADPDQDGLTNLQEYLCGTDPLAPQSSLKLESSDRGGQSGITLSFNARPGKAYTIQYRESLTSGGWIKLTDVFARPTAWKVEVPDAGAQTGAGRYYRLVTPAQF